MNVTEESALGRLQGVEEYQQLNSKVFRSIQALRWSIRVNRAELDACAGILYIAGRVWIQPALFDACIMKPRAPKTPAKSAWTVASACTGAVR